MEYELKYTLSNHNAMFLKDWLSNKFVPDGEHASGIITSVYYDTFSMAAYYEKRNSDYIKRKIRLRWYCDLATKQPDNEAFMEVKQRVGSQRRKSRILSNILPSELEEIDLDSPKLLHELGDTLGIHSMFPSVMIRYKRFRFVDPVTNSRLSVDMNIRAHKIHPQVGTEASFSVLPVAVFEYKGQYSRLNPIIKEVGLMGCRKSSFSKYESVIKWVKSNSMAI